MSDPFSADPIVVEVIRDGLVESVHRARVAITGPDGALVAGIGSVQAPMFPRSALKPLQAVAMLRAGLELDPDLLALVCASHSGEGIHLDGVRRILAGAGLDETALDNTAGWPLDEQAREDQLRAGGSPSRLAMNCSGKHAGMLATCVRNGWPVTGYRRADHPLQRAVRETVDELAGEASGTPAVDGCGAPALPLPLAGLARAFGRLAAAASGPERVVADAVRAHPEMVSGTRRDEYLLHQAVPGLVTKAGAEAVQAVGLADGRGVAIKVDDGGPRARPVVTAAVLAVLGLDHPTLTAQASAPVLGHGEPVGVIRVRAGVLDHLGERRRADPEPL